MAQQVWSRRARQSTLRPRVATRNGAEEFRARHFYITFATHAEHWSGHLTIGQHYYWWTSPDVGDAYLLDTEECATLEEAIVALKAEMTHLCRALSIA